MVAGGCELGFQEEGERERDFKTSVSKCDGPANLGGLEDSLEQIGQERQDKTRKGTVGHMGWLGIGRSYGVGRVPAPRRLATDRYGSLQW